MIIRDARADDGAAIADIWNPVIRDTAITFTSTERTALSLAGDIAARQAEGFPFLLAEDGAVPGGPVLGFASYGPFRAGPGYVRTVEHTLILTPEARGRGIGRALLEALEDRARAGGVLSLIAAISAENPGAIAFHRRMAFTQVGYIAQAGWKFGRARDLVLMQKLLAAAP